MHFRAIKALRKQMRQVPDEGAKQHQVMHICVQGKDPRRERRQIKAYIEGTDGKYFEKLSNHDVLHPGALPTIYATVTKIRVPCACKRDEVQTKSHKTWSYFGHGGLENWRLCYPLLKELSKVRQKVPRQVSLLAAPVYHKRPQEHRRSSNGQLSTLL